MSKSMKRHWTTGLLHWLQALLQGKQTAPSDIVQARRLIAAIDRGGVPLNPARINAIARDLGLEVSRHARAEETIQRIRQAIARST
jgi:hypothetical protein